MTRPSMDSKMGEIILSKFLLYNLSSWADGRDPLSEMVFGLGGAY